MKKLILLLIVGSLFIGCSIMTYQDLSVSSNVKAVMTTDEGEFVFFVPNTAYKSQNDKDRQFQELLKKNAELEAKIKYLENKKLLDDF